MNSQNRRHFVGACGAGIATLLAGCSGGSDESNNRKNTTQRQSTTDDSFTPVRDLGTQTPVGPATGSATPFARREYWPNRPVPTEPPEERWQETLSSEITSLGFDERSLAVGTESGTIRALSLTDGSERWSLDVPGDGQYNYPSVIGPATTDLLFVGTADNHYFAYHRGDQRVHWDRELPGEGTEASIVSSAALVDGSVYFGSYNGVFYALDASTGAEQWTETFENRLFASPVVTDEIVATSTPQGVVGFDAMDGTRAWEVNEYTHWHLAASGESVIATQGISAGDGSVCAALDRSTGDVTWTYDVSQRTTPSAIAIDDTYVFLSVGTSFDDDEKHQLHALDRVSGNLTWTEEFDSGRVSHLAAFDDGIVGVTDTEMFALNPADGNSLWRTTYGGPDPSLQLAVGSDALYLADLDSASISTLDG